MGGFMEYDGNQPIRTLLPNQLEGYSLTGNGDFPRIAIEEIQDKSKGDAISKGLVILQTGWFIMQCIARGIQGLPITELELVTIAFSVLTFVMYWVWWDKPLHVQRAVRVYKKRNPNEPSADGPAATNEASFWPTLRFSLPALPSSTPYEWGEWDGSMGLGKCPMVFRPILMIHSILHGADTVVEDRKRIHAFYPQTTGHSTSVVLVVAPAVAALFGAIHCAAWSIAFPSDAERMLWRISAVAIAGLPVAFALFMVFWNLYLPVSVSILVSSTYVLSRISLLVLSVLSLRALPPEAYLSVHWTALIPHV
jgi:hypothetical protein